MGVISLLCNEWLGLIMDGLISQFKSKLVEEVKFLASSWAVLACIE